MVQIHLPIHFYSIVKGLYEIIPRFETTGLYICNDFLGLTIHKRSISWIAIWLAKNQYVFYLPRDVNKHYTCFMDMRYTEQFECRINRIIPEVMPDFYNQNMVLDAKYKGYRDWKSVSREDRFQLLSYMYIFRSIHSGFIVPVDNATLQTSRNLNGYGGTMSLFGMNVSINHQCFNDYILHMITEESMLKGLILSIDK